MDLLFGLKTQLWRRLPLRQRQRLLSALERGLPPALMQRALGAVGGGVFRREVRETGLLFIHVPKAAGTSIARAVYGIEGVGHYRALEARACDPRLFERLYRFAVVRNPWERLLSAYRFARQGGTGEVVVNNAAFYRDRVPDRFDRFVLEWLPQQPPQRLDPIFMPQHLFVCDAGGGLLVHDLYDLGEMERLARELSARLGRPLAIPRSNATGSGAELARQYRDPVVVSAVADYYARDVALFDYRFAPVG
jgi:hypothetical protein